MIKTNRQQNKLFWIIQMLSAQYFCRVLKLYVHQNWILLQLCINFLGETLALFPCLSVSGHNSMVVYLANFYETPVTDDIENESEYFLKQMKNKHLISSIKSLIKFSGNINLQIWKKNLKIFNSYSRENLLPWDNKIKYSCILTIFIIENILKIISYVQAMRTDTTEIKTSNVNYLALIQ